MPKICLKPESASLKKHNLWQWQGSTAAVSLENNEILTTVLTTLKCGIYSKAAIKWKRRLFQRKNKRSHETLKLFHCPFRKNKLLTASCY